MTIKSFKKLLSDAKKQDIFWIENAKLEFSIQLNRFFKKKGITYTELAQKMNTSPAYITKVFRGDANFTIETMVKLARSVDGELQINITPKQSKDIWYEALKNQPIIGRANEDWLKRVKEAKNGTVSAAA